MSDEAAIGRMIQEWCAATNQPGDAGADGYASFAAEDAVLQPPNAARVQGREAIRAWILDFTQADDWWIDWAPDHVEVSSSGDTAYGVGHYELRLRDADGELGEDKGKWLDVFEKQADGSWKVVALSFNSDLPA